MSATLMKGLANVGVDSLRYSGVSHLKSFLSACNNFPLLLNTVAPIIETSTRGLISRSKLEELAADPDKLDGEIKEKLLEAVEKIDLKKILSSVPGVGDILNLGKKGIDTITETGTKIVDSVKPHAEKVLGEAKSFLGIKDEGTDKVKESSSKSTTEKTTTENKTETKTSNDNKSGDPKPGIWQRIKAYYKQNPKKTIIYGGLGAIITWKIIIPIIWKIIKLPLIIIGMIFGFNKAKGYLGGGTPPSPDDIRNMHRAPSSLGEEEAMATDGSMSNRLKNMVAGDTKNGDENLIQKGINAGHRILENTVPGWKQLGGHKLTNRLKRWAPGQEIPIEASPDSLIGGGAGNGNPLLN